MYEFSGRLTKVTSKHQEFRTRSVEGRFGAFPTLGQQFLIIGESLTPGPGMRRMVETSRVQEIKVAEAGVMVFRTNNSTYELEYEVQ